MGVRRKYSWQRLGRTFNIDSRYTFTLFHLTFIHTYMYYVQMQVCECSSYSLIFFIHTTSSYVDVIASDPFFRPFIFYLLVSMCLRMGIFFTWQTRKEYSSKTSTTTTIIPLTLFFLLSSGPRISNLFYFIFFNCNLDEKIKK